MFQKKMIIGMLATLFFAQSTFALNIDESNPISTTIKKHTLIGAQPSKEIVLMNLNLTPKEIGMIKNYKPKATSLLRKSTLPEKVDVGMNGVPVLDQGRHGSCVTFANTGAVDALLGKGDYVSQLCNLELGRYLKLRSGLPSGWNGSIGELVLEQMIRFGVINKKYQSTKSCGGLTDYPVYDSEEMGKAMTLDEFNAGSEKIYKNIWWKPVLHWTERFDENTLHPYDGVKVVDEVKQYLAQNPKANSRFTFGVILPYTYCSAGACGKYHSTYDSWVLTDEINNDPKDLGGHEMIITGYDDNAVAVDESGKSHKGLFTIRNSWGEDAGDHGNYYMSYDYFMKFTDEIQKITSEKMAM